MYVKLTVNRWGPTSIMPGWVGKSAEFRTECMKLSLYGGFHPYVIWFYPEVGVYCFQIRATAGVLKEVRNPAVSKRALLHLKLCVQAKGIVNRKVLYVGRQTIRQTALEVSWREIKSVAMLMSWRLALRPGHITASSGQLLARTQIHFFLSP